MTMQIIKHLTVIFIVMALFWLLLLLPRELKITQQGPLSFIGTFPFTLEIFQNNIHAFIKGLQTNGLGETPAGVPLTVEAQRLMGRSLKIIIPCFFFSMAFGTALGVVIFHLRDKITGKILSFFAWIFSSIPDFFLFIAIQYLFIMLIKSGFPHFNLYGNDDWYSFIIPFCSLTLFPLIHIAKFTSSSLESEMDQEYVRTALAKGLTRFQVLLRMLKNCFGGLLIQTQVIMIYILSSLPVIEKLSSYHGAGYHLLGSILKNEDNQAFVLMVPFLLLMLVTVISAQLLKTLLFPKREVG